MPCRGEKRWALASDRASCHATQRRAGLAFWLRTNGVNTTGVAAKVMNSDRLGKKVRPGTFGNIAIYEWEYPKSPSAQKHESRSGPISADPICPSPFLLIVYVMFAAVLYVS